LQNIGEKIGRNTYIGNINFTILNGIKINDINIILKNGSEISLQNSDFDIGIFGVLFNKSVKGNAYLQNVKYSKDKTSVSIVLRSDFDIKFASFSQYPSKGDMKLELQNIIANGITIQGFEIPPVRFSSIRAELNLLNNKLNLNDIVFTGPDLKGNISGSIVLAKFLQQSQLNINITVDSSSALLDNYKILLESMIDESNKIQLNIKGTLSNPKIETNKSRQEISNRKTDSEDLLEQKFKAEANTEDVMEKTAIKNRRESFNNIKKSRPVTPGVKAF